MPNKLFPCLWFDGKAKEAADFYCSIFKDSKILSANPMAVIFELNETKFMALNGGPEYQFSIANSYVITCDSQEEIDYYWDHFAKEGKPGKCGWMVDKYGVSWKIVPAILGALMNDPEKAPRVMYAFMQMSKFEIDKLINA
jgi:predicted 3-demethylubiquinone-9 3-methyltransferase (glyoxalase superfamily)